VQPLAPTVPSDVRVLLKSLELLPEPSVWQGMPPSPEGMLGSALSLSETVRLGAELDQVLVASDGNAVPLEQRARWSKSAAARLEALRRRVALIYGDAFAAKGLPDAGRMHAMLIDLDAFGGRPEPRARVARMWAASYAQLLLDVLARIRRELELFKYDLAPQLRAGAPAAATLLQLDATLDAVLARMSQAAHQRLCAGFEARCSAQFERAIEALDPATGVEGLAAMLAPRGLAARLLDTSRKLALALLDLEWSALQGLIDAACAAAPQPEAQP